MRRLAWASLAAATRQLSLVCIHFFTKSMGHLGKSLYTGDRMNTPMNYTRVHVTEATKENVMRCDTVWVCDYDPDVSYLIDVFRKHLADIGHETEPMDINRSDIFGTLVFRDSRIRFIVENEPVETPLPFTGKYNVLTPLRWLADSPQRVSTIRRAFAKEMEKIGYTVHPRLAEQVDASQSDAPGFDFVVVDDAKVHNFRTLTYAGFNVYYSV